VTLNVVIARAREVARRSAKHLLFIFCQSPVVRLKGLSPLKSHDHVLLRVKFVEELLDG